MDPCTLQQIRAAFGVSVDGFLALLAGVIAYAGAVRGAEAEEIASICARSTLTGPSTRHSPSLSAITHFMRSVFATTANCFWRQACAGNALPTHCQ